MFVQETNDALIAIDRECKFASKRRCVPIRRLADLPHIAQATAIADVEDRGNTYLQTNCENVMYERLDR